jgi:hypothetical protein
MSSFDARVEKDLEALYAYKREVKQALRSGNPALRAEAKKYLAMAEEEIVALKRILG